MDADQHAFDEWAQRRRRRRTWMIVGALIVGSLSVFIASIRLWPRGETVAQVYQDLETQFATRDDQVRNLAESLFTDDNIELLHVDDRHFTVVALLLDPPLSSAALIRVVQPLVDFEKSSSKRAFKGYIYYDRRVWSLQEEINGVRAFSMYTLFLNATSGGDWVTTISGPVPDRSSVGGCVEAFTRQVAEVHGGEERFVDYDAEKRDYRLEYKPLRRMNCMPALIVWVIERFLPGSLRAFQSIPNLNSFTVQVIDDGGRVASVEIRWNGYVNARRKYWETGRYDHLTELKDQRWAYEDEFESGLITKSEFNSRTQQNREEIHAWYSEVWAAAANLGGIRVTFDHKLATGFTPEFKGY